MPSAEARDGLGIAIGGSAGALATVGALLAAIPPTYPGAAFVVLHIPAEGPSRLAAVLGAQTRIAVREPDDKEPIAPATAYVAPAGYHMLVEAGGRVALSMDEPVYHSRPSIDVLFESVAFAYRARALGIALSGGSRDGAAGLAAIARCGGATWVQDPRDAAAATLPKAAIDVARPHRVMSAFALARALSELCAAGQGVS